MTSDSGVSRNRSNEQAEDTYLGVVEKPISAARTSSADIWPARLNVELGGPVQTGEKLKFPGGSESCCKALNYAKVSQAAKCMALDKYLDVDVALNKPSDV